MSVARAIMSSMSIDNELLRSLCDHPATGPRLVEYLVTGKWTKPEAGDTTPESERPAVMGPGGPAAG
jgi:hypothetical protein